MKHDLNAIIPWPVRANSSCFNLNLGCEQLESVILKHKKLLFQFESMLFTIGLYVFLYKKVVVLI